MQTIANDDHFILYIYIYIYVYISYTPCVEALVVRLLTGRAVVQIPLGCRLRPEIAT
jgi:hypothetical protein